MWGAVRAVAARAATVAVRAVAVRAVVALAAPPVWRSAAVAAVGVPAARGFKTKSSLKKRFRLKASGAVVRRMSGKHHKMLCKSSSRGNRLSE